ncbi:hypothetical protein [Vibrio salinus]|uniref:hypothetical protein n=1 Tax=Vibrio salinus TaxID=2899784 RepID=UPI001E34D5B8|nr:hypothetical protein [Vibrio salinus]MCE0493765.1 hypothetical protein [Vibrio salinus]
MDNLTICLYGHICRDNSANLKSFWNGFINIQKQIPKTDNINIVAHSWNPEFYDLVQKVYAPKHLIMEKQENFIGEYMPLIQPIDKFELGIKRANSLWVKSSPQSFLGMSKTRSKTVELLELLDDVDEQDWVLVARWDQGCAGSREVNQIVADSALPKGYIYLSYFREIDEGYADMWFFTTKELAKKFSTFSDFVLECLSGQNDYFYEFTEKGWPLAIRKKAQNRLQLIFEYKIAPRLVKIFENLSRLNMPPQVKNKMLGAKQRLFNYLYRPSVTGENALSLNEPTDITYPTYQALNIHAIFKYFFKEKKLREKARFLDIKDFENLNSGQVINAKRYAYIIYSHSSFSDCWKMAINQARENLSPECSSIFILSEDSLETELAYKKLEIDAKIIKYADDDLYSERLKYCFNKLKSECEFVYFVHEDMPLIDKVDRVYLNSLLHFLDNSNEFYIKLVDTNYVDKKLDHEVFPDLMTNRGGYSFSIQPSIMKLSNMISFLSGFNHGIYDMEKVSICSNFVFSAVKGERKVGKYLLANDKFPHIATAIAKGKWCTSEWHDEINFLSKKYGIDLSKRGEC